MLFVFFGRLFVKWTLARHGAAAAAGHDDPSVAFFLSLDLSASINFMDSGCEHSPGKTTWSYSAKMIIWSDQLVSAVCVCVCFLFAPKWGGRRTKTRGNCATLSNNPEAQKGKTGWVRSCWDDLACCCWLELKSWTYYSGLFLCIPWSGHTRVLCYKGTAVELQDEVPLYTCQ